MCTRISHACMYVLYIYIHTQLNTWTCHPQTSSTFLRYAYIYTHIYIHTHTVEYIDLPPANKLHIPQICIHLNIHLHTYTQTQLNTWTCHPQTSFKFLIYAYMHTYIYIHTHTQLNIWTCHPQTSSIFLIQVPKDPLGLSYRLGRICGRPSELGTR